MDRSSEDESFPDYHFDSMEDGDFNCEHFVSDDISGEHDDKQSTPNQACSSAAVHSLPIDVSNGESAAYPNHQGDEAQEQGGNEGLNEEEPISDRGINPILLPHVIRNVLRHLPAKDVETCRLVCKAWNAEACTALQTKRLVAFMDANAVRSYNNAMRDTNDFPHAQYEFCFEDFTGLFDENVREFWTLFGPHIKVLEFRQKRLFWRDFLEVVGKKTPRLEKLFFRHPPRNIHNRNVTIGNHRIPSIKELRLASLPISMEQLKVLLKALPNLEVIEFLPIRSLSLKTKISSLLMNTLVSPDVNLPQIKRFNINLELSYDRIERLTTKFFPLERLHITLADGDAITFKKLLDSLRTTLSELKVSFPDSLNYPVECVQVLSNLKKLKMTNFDGSINFVQKLPKLQHLQFITQNPEKSIPFGFQMLNGPSLRSEFSRNVDHTLKILKIRRTNATAETLSLESIARCFPYLTCLHLQDADDDGLGVIYRNLPFLSDVKFTKATCTDQGLTGIPLETCNEILEAGALFEGQSERRREDLFIGNLQFLQKFSIVATKISDASIALGLVDCKDLKDLKIGSPRITDAGLIIATDKFYKQITSLDVTECANFTERGKSYAREKLMGKLKVADLSQDSQIETKRIKRAGVSNADREIARSTGSTTSYSGSLSTSSYYDCYLQDTEFFEERFVVDTRERGDLRVLSLADYTNGLADRMGIREALRRNGDLLRTFQRMGPQQFRRLHERQFDEVQADQPLERNMPRLLPQNEQIDGEVQPVVPALLEEDDGGHDAGNMGPDRLPEIYIAEIFRLGLTLEEVEDWLRNPHLFEREENNRNPNNNPPIVRHAFRNGQLRERN